jgi:autotransporter-associated beta strand protein
MKTRILALLCASACALSNRTSAVPVTFRAEMGYQISLGNFTSPGDHLEVQSGFNLNGPWQGHELTNVPSTTLYQNTFDITNPAPGSVVEYKFHIWGTHDTWEGGDNRTFTLATSAQTLPVRYFNDVGPPVAVTSQVDMSVQITKLAFNPANDLVEARGSFQSPNGWAGAPNAFYLTNDGSGVYTNTYGISNTPPSSPFYYKFFVATNGVDTGNGWEAVGNRSFIMPSSATTIPKAYFNDDLPPNLVTFQVDMYYVAYQYTLTNVEARGSFQIPNAWTGGFTLTNNPSAANPYLYTGTCNDSQLPRTVEYYKFVSQSANSGDLHWEDDPNRSFTLATSSQTLPVTLFNRAYETPVSSTWTNKQGGSWLLPANWSNGVFPRGVNATADFSTLALANDVTVTLDGARTISTLLFDDQNSTKHNWTLAPGAGGSLTLAVSNGSPLITVGSATTTLSAVLAGTNGLVKFGSGTLLLSATNTYTGATTVSNGTLLVNGSLGSGVIGRLTISNTLSLAGTTVMDLNKAAGTSDQVVGLTTVTYGGTLVVTNLAGSLAAGDSFKLFDAANYTGSFSAIMPTSPGSGLWWDTNSLASSGTLRVAGPPQPAITSVALLSGTNLVISGTNGTSGHDCPVKLWPTLVSMR